MRVYHVKKSRKSYSCCKGDTIEIGEPYSYTAPRYDGPIRNFCRRHPPRPSDLAGGKLADLYAAQEGLEDDISAFLAGELEDLEGPVSTAAEEAERIADEYEESIDNMPEGLQESPVAEDCRERAEAARAWAEELRGVDLEMEEFDEDSVSRGDFETDEEYKDALEKAREEFEQEQQEKAVEELRGISLEV